MLDRLKAMLIKEFTQILRDPRMRFIIFGVPVVQIILFGYAVNTDVKNISTAICDLDNTTSSRELVAQLERSGYFQITKRIERDEQIKDLLDRGEVRTVIKLMHGFEGMVRQGDTATLQIIVDGTDANTAGIVLSHAVKIASRFGDQLLTERYFRLNGRNLPVAQLDLASRAWFNENLESRNYYVPGVTALMVMITTMMLSSMAVVREKEIGTIEQIIVTPIRRWEFIVGKTVPFVLIGYINVTIVIVIATLWFDIPFRGSVATLYGATGLYLMSTLGFGLLISTVSQTQQQAMMSSFMFTFPAMLLSGFAFPIENMPRSIQYLTYANPLRYYLVCIRGIFLKGVSSDILWPQFLGLFVIGSTILTFAVLRFRKSV
jgi:ABC-2 type transport system permease protein